MKVMMIEPLGDGGITHYSYNLLNALYNRNVDVSLATASSYEFKDKKHIYPVYPVMFFFAAQLIYFFPQLSAETRIPSIFRRIIKVLEYPFNILHLYTIIKRNKIRIVHIQSVNWIEVLMVIFFRLVKRKVIFTIHNVSPLHNKMKSYHKMLYRILYHSCDQLIIHTEEGKEKIVSIFNVSRQKISVIPHGDYKFFIPQTRISKYQAKKELGIESNYNILLFFGAIRANKGLEQALFALKKIINRMNEVKLVIAGECCEDYNKYKTIIDKLDLQKYIYEFLYYIPHEQVPDFFLASDIVILPYHDITQSGVLQIAYAFSKPVIATDLDGFRESIEKESNGYLFKDGDYEAFANLVVYLLNNKSKLNEMGRRSRMIADQKYSWEKISDATRSVYCL